MASVASRVAAAFVEAGLLTRGAASRFDSFDDFNLLVRLLSCCSDDQSNRTRRRLVQLIENDYQLVVSTSLESNLIGERLILSRRLPRFSRRIGVLSSRLSRRLDEKDAWFDALRTCILKSNPRRDWFVLCDGTSTHPFVGRSVDLFGRRSVQIHLPNVRDSIATWLSREIWQANAAQEPWSIHISPSIVADHELEAMIPLQDRAIASFSDQLVAIEINRNGNIHRLLSQLLKGEHRRMGSVRIFLNPSVGNSRVVEEFLESGAVGLALNGNECCRW